MHNVHVDFKRYFKFLTPEEKFIEINRVINELNKSDLPGQKIPKRFCILKELNDIKKERIHKDHYSHILVAMISFTFFMGK